MVNYFELANISYRYPDGTHALRDLSLTIGRGERIALIGHNGAGKSTLFQQLNGILQPTTGEVLFNGQKMSYRKKELKRVREHVGIVFQDPDAQLFSGNVKQDIAFGPTNLGLTQQEVQARVDWAIAQTEIDSLADKPIHFLSLGQKKRVAIAGVLAMQPAVLILDEPTAGLDHYYANQIFSLLRQLETPERTVLLSTHDTQLAYEWADRIVVLHEGTIIYDGNPYDIFSQDDLLQKAHLEKPWVFDVATTLGAPTPLPRTRAALKDFLRTKTLG
ncbi:energy-coupling factor ABC transporter ATP-binding protein [Metalysinibacillus jejuensis]|uniref:energy-coupling factor ABC transporter ATP-binding protein n=1 Tax=Metalysinibacillus jejuensis TaxID=914327 RepID=UPI000D3C5285|nr:ATP-binding cassette domain-containing protein [Metalysinibacillus jejuensis]